MADEGGPGHHVQAFDVAHSLCEDAVHEDESDD